MKKQICLTLLAVLCLSIVGFCQGTIKGKLTDSASRAALSLATVTIFDAKDTNIITYRLSNAEGEFKIPGLPFNQLFRMVVSFNGYGGYRKEFTLTEKEPMIDLGIIAISKSAQTLDEVVIFSERPPVIVKQDTVEFNASAFKTLPDALVEDLLKKLPGVQVDKDGNIMVNGKPVNRILVDGKTFFGDDPKMATRNLPANVIDKVQVTDDKEEMLRNDITNPNDVGKVVNITLKKGVKKGWFGKLYAGGGTQNVYEAGGIANIYRDTLQLSVLGYMNNLNRPGFSYGELLQTGGLNRSRDNSASSSTSIWRSSNGTGVSINGINFGGQQNYGGIATSKGLGFNLNHTPNAKRSFFAQYFFGNVSIDRTNTSNTDQFIADTVVNNHRVLTGDVENNSHNVNVGLRLKPDSVTNVLINAGYTLGLQQEQRISDISTGNNFLGALSDGDIFQNNPASTRYYRHFMSLTRLSKQKKGRRFVFNHWVDINNRLNDYSTDYLLHYHYPNTYDSAMQQLRLERIPRTDVVTTGLFVNPLSKSLTWRFGVRHEYGILSNRINTFNKSNGSSEFDLPNEALSSDFRRTGYRFLFTAGIEYKYKEFTLSPTIRYQLQNYHNVLSSSALTVNQQKNAWLPALSIVYKKFSFNYSSDVALPGYYNLLPVTDNTNPYFISRGNTNLLPSVRHNFSANYNYNNPKTNLNAFLYANGSFANNDVIQSVVVDDKGVQTSTPVNANGSKSFYVNYNISKQYKNNPKFIFNWNIGANNGFSNSLLLYNNVSNRQTTFNFNNWLSGGVNINDQVEYNVNLNVGFNFTRYSGKIFKPINNRSTWLDNNLVIRIPKRFAWETNFNVDFNNALPAGQQQIQRWNAALSYSALSSKALVFKCTVFDILNTNRNISSSVNRNTYSTNQTNTLPQYFLLTATYNVRPYANTGKSSNGKKGGMFLF